MIYQNRFIDEPILKYKVLKFLEEELSRAGVANIDIQRTPLVTRIILEVSNPARIIGKKGGYINKLTEKLKTKFGIQNPQISVVEVKNFYLEPRLVGKKAARLIEMGRKVRPVVHRLLSEIMASGAVGAEIRVAGAMSKGTRAKKFRAQVGYIPKAGEPVRLVKEAHVVAVTKVGAIGITVRIVPPGTQFPDKKAEMEKN
jgi:small subunit ribosomal protein S3